MLYPGNEDQVESGEEAGVGTLDVRGSPFHPAKDEATAIRGDVW